MKNRDYYEGKVNEFLGVSPRKCDTYKLRIIEFLNQMDEEDERFLGQLCTMAKLHMERKK